MLYCLKCQKIQKAKSQGLIMFHETAWFVIVKKLRFVKEQEASELLKSLGIKTPLSQVPIFGTILFWG